MALNTTGSPGGRCRPMLSKLDCPFEVKAADEAGNFEGYAAVF
ncbi:TPA: HK97 family phage prohead protease, partial [Pseudomonas aeruginosa]